MQKKRRPKLETGAAMFGSAALRTVDAPAHRYIPPIRVLQIELGALLDMAGRSLGGGRTPELFARAEPNKTAQMPIYYAGNLDLVRKPCVAIVGTRKVSDEGAKRARRLA
jgi:DNA processing protein